jgi:hypothetical protein
MGAEQTKFQPPPIAVRRIPVNQDTVSMDHLRTQRFGGLDIEADKCWLYVSMHEDQKEAYVRMRNAKKFIVRGCPPEAWQDLLRTSESDLLLQGIGENWLKIKAASEDYLFRLDARAPTLDPLPPPPELAPGTIGTLSVTFSPACTDDHLILHRLCGPTSATVPLLILESNAGADGVFLQTPNNNLFFMPGRLPPQRQATCTYYSEVAVRISVGGEEQRDLIMCRRVDGARKPSSATGVEITLFEDELHHYYPCLNIHRTHTTYRLKPSADSWLTEADKITWMRIFVQNTNLELTNQSSAGLSLRDIGSGSCLEFVKITSNKDTLSPIKTCVDLEVSVSSPADIRMAHILFGELNNKPRHVHTTTIWYDNEPLIQTFNRYVWKPQPQDILPASLAAKFWDIFKMDPSAFAIMSPSTATIQTPLIRLAIRDAEKNMFIDFHLVTDVALSLRARCLLSNIDAILGN